MGVLKRQSKCYLDKTKEVVVVGGGPAGVHMAVSLAQMGLKKVTLIEAEERVGGKSMTRQGPDGVRHELGTCYLHKLYGPIRELLRKYDSDNVELPLGGEGVRKVFGSDLKGGNDEDFTNGQEFGDWVYAKAEESSELPKRCMSCCPDFLQCGRILSGIDHYRKLHQQQFGEYHLYGVPPKPKKFKKIDMSAFEYLEKNNLLVLEGLLRYAQQAQGYGVLEDLPALYMLWWIHPDLLSGLVGQILKGESGVTVLSKGYQSLWEAMVAAQLKASVDGSFNVITGARVASANRNLGKRNGKPKVVYLKNGRLETVTCDRLIMAIDLSRYLNTVADLTDEEELVFADYESSVLSTTLYQASPVEHEHAVELWPARMRPDEARDGPGVEGRMYLHRNSRLAVQGKDAGTQDPEYRVAYQYLGRALQDADGDRLKDQLLKDLEGVGETGVKVLEQQPWSYMPRFTAKGLKKGNPWKILRLQGKNRTFWIGSSVCFESVLDVVAYNDKLLKAMCEKDAPPPSGGGRGVVVQVEADDKHDDTATVAATTPQGVGAGSAVVPVVAEDKAESKTAAVGDDDAGGGGGAAAAAADDSGPSSGGAGG